jgi:spore coat protein U-like protein
MTFDAYTGSDTITKTSTVTVDCSSGTNYTISFANVADGNGKYILQRFGGDVNSANQLLVSFANGASAAMTSGAATITGTGAGTSSSAGTITGTILSGQTGKTAGTYNATMTLNLVY